jgi:IS5 family transposase
MQLAKRLIVQAKDTKTKNKLYWLHEQDVDCISKGKARKRYEFGTKVGIVCTQKENFVTGMRSYPGNPYDGHTLDDMLQQSETITSTMAKTVVVDLGYRGKHDTRAGVIHRGRKLSKRQKKRLRRRLALEAIIGHMKVDGLLERCHLKGTNCNAIHALLCGIGHNLRQKRAFGYGCVVGFGYGAIYIKNCPTYRNILVLQCKNVIRMFSKPDCQIGVCPQNRVVQGEPRTPNN